LEFTATATTFGYGALFAQEVLDSDEGAIAMSISTVPGCVNPAFIPPLCYVDGIQPTLGWKTTGNADYCQLTIGQRYYLNFTYGTRSTPGPAPFCVGSCRRRILSFVQ
jgi:hypothetical protein